LRPRPAEAAAKVVAPVALRSTNFCLLGRMDSTRSRFVTSADAPFGSRLVSRSPRSRRTAEVRASFRSRARPML